MKKFGTVEIWLESDSLKDILNKDFGSLNLNIFSKNPQLSYSDWYDPIKIKIDIYGAENVGF